jgi:DNA invertase Pin-like site-specific DNA recombinase
MTGIPNAAALLRCSTDKQDQEMQTQRRLIRASLGDDCDIVWFEEPDTSGKLPFDERPTLQACLAYARKHDVPFVVSTLDRFARRMWETLRFFEEQVKTNKICLHICDDPFMDKEYFSIKCAISQMEREKISKRTRQELQTIRAEIAEQGFHVARKSGRRIVSLGAPSEALAVAQAKGGEATRRKTAGRNEELLPLLREMRAEGKTLNQIAKALNTRKVPMTSGKAPSPAGPAWHPSSVSNVLRRDTA